MKLQYHQYIKWKIWRRDCPPSGAPRRSKFVREASKKVSIHWHFSYFGVHPHALQSEHSGGERGGEKPMGRQVDKLTARKVDTIKAPGRHSDGGGLYLNV